MVEKILTGIQNHIKIVSTEVGRYNKCFNPINFDSN
jgi:hypothetical protein